MSQNNDITSLLVQMGRGKVIEGINNEFRLVVDDVINNGGSGELTIKIKVKGASYHEDGRMTEVGVTHSVSSKRPKKDLGPSTFFITREGVLTRNNPEQVEMFEEPVPVKEKR